MQCYCDRETIREVPPRDGVRTAIPVFTSHFEFVGGLNIPNFDPERNLCQQDRLLCS